MIGGAFDIGDIGFVDEESLIAAECRGVKAATVLFGVGFPPDAAVLMSAECSAGFGEYLA